MSLNPDSIVETLLHLSGKDKKKQNEDEAKHKDKQSQKKQAKSKQEGEDLHKAKGDASLAAH
jgi:hypothetical protein